MRSRKVFSILTTFLAGMALLVLGGCSDHQDKKNQELKVGVISGPESEVMQVAIEQATKQFGLKARIVEFQDYVTPNLALADGSIDVNAYQHKAYLDDTIKSRNLPLVSVGKTFIYPIGAYSKKLSDIKQLVNKAKVAIPNDPSNESRALHLLQSAGIIGLDSTLSEENVTPANIVSNPKNLAFLEMDAAQLPRALDDVDLAVINSTYSVANGLLPANALLIEKNDSPYVNLLVARKDNQNDPRIKELVSAFQSQPVIEKANTLFKGSAIPGWTK